MNHGSHENRDPVAADVNMMGSMFKLLKIPLVAVALILQELCFGFGSSNCCDNEDYAWGSFDSGIYVMCLTITFVLGISYVFRTVNY